MLAPDWESNEPSSTCTISSALASYNRSNCIPDRAAPGITLILTTKLWPALTLTGAIILTADVPARTELPEENVVVIINNANATEKTIFFPLIIDIPTLTNILENWICLSAV